MIDPAIISAAAASVVSAIAATVAAVGIWDGIRAMVSANKDRAGILDQQRDADERRHDEAPRFRTRPRPIARPRRPHGPCRRPCGRTGPRRRVQQPVDSGSLQRFVVLHIVEGSPAVFVARAGVRAGPEQRQDHGKVGARIPKHGKVGARINPNPRRHPMKRRIAVFTARVGVRPAFNQRLDHGRVGIPPCRRPMKRRIAVFIGRVGVRPAFDQRVITEGLALDSTAP